MLLLIMELVVEVCITAKYLTLAFVDCGISLLGAVSCFLNAEHAAMRGVKCQKSQEHYCQEARLWV